MVMPVKESRVKISVKGIIVRLRSLRANRAAHYKLKIFLWKSISIILSSNGMMKGKICDCVCFKILISNTSKVGFEVDWLAHDHKLIPKSIAPTEGKTAKNCNCGK